MTEATRLDALCRMAEAAGLVVRGQFATRPDDGVPPVASGVPAGAVVLLGFAGRQGFPTFDVSPERHDGLPHPLDRWSRRVIEACASSVGGLALFPFGGPPWLPFQRWARRAEDVRPSPIGLLLHPVWGLWHSYRGAVALPGRFEITEPERREIAPCALCATRPCLATCPVGAFSETGYDIASCAAHLARPEGQACMTGGCLARRACPVGADHAPEPAQASFTMAAFLRARTVGS